MWLPNSTRITFEKGYVVIIESEMLCHGMSHMDNNYLPQV